jgi:hypothetical protein
MACLSQLCPTGNFGFQGSGRTCASTWPQGSGTQELSGGSGGAVCLNVLLASSRRLIKFQRTLKRDSLKRLHSAGPSRLGRKSFQNNKQQPCTCDYVVQHRLAWPCLDSCLCCPATHVPLHAGRHHQLML